MRIQIHKGDGRHTLRCFRDDGSSTAAETGPGLPAHDLAHYVGERALGLAAGFFGQVAAGRSLRELSDPAVIRGLGDEAWIAEALAGVIGSMATGACEPEQVRPLLAAQLGERYARIQTQLGDDVILAMWERFEELLGAWNALPVGESLGLDWPT